MSAFLAAGRTLKTVGLDGGIKVAPSSDFRDERFKVGNALFLEKEKGGETEKLIIKRRTKAGTFEILVFSGHEDVDKARLLVGKELLVEKDRSLLRDGQYFFDDLVGLRASFAGGDFIGEVSEVEEYGPYATLRIKRAKGQDVLVPFVEAFINKVDLENGTIAINYMKGLA